MARIGVDVGGTFTDCLLVDDKGNVHAQKVPSTPADPSLGFIKGVSQLVETTGISPKDIHYVGHGTTVATNTIITRTGIRVGVLLTEGFGDLLFMRRLRFANPTNMNAAHPSQLVTRHDVHEISERMSSDGKPLTPIDLEQTVERAQHLVKERKVEAIVVSFLNSYRNSAHERAAVEAIRAAMPDIFVCCSSEVWARPREYERSMVALINGYIHKKMHKYLEHVEDRVSSLGLGSLVITRSNGGIMSAAEAARYPAYTMLSGPAAGVMGACNVAAKSAFDRIITWDMGGTSLDVSIINQRPAYTDNAIVGDFPLFVPTLDVISVGAGGGSIGWITESGLLQVGPRSAGSNPGPACYGLGGMEPTLTDAYVTLGIIDPSHFAGGGEIVPDVKLAEAALAGLGEKIGLSAVQMAEALVTVATAQMHATFMPLLARYGADPTEFALLPFGGAGPTHCFFFAKACGFDKVLVPPNPGLLCAYGAICSDLRYEVPGTLDVDIDILDFSELGHKLNEMTKEAEDWLKRQKLPISSITMSSIGYMRYHGQSFEIAVPLRADRMSKEALRADFIDTYRRRYGYADPEAPVEIVDLAVQVIGATNKPELETLSRPVNAGSRPVTPKGSRQVYIDGKWMTVKAVERVSLKPGDRFEGPIVIDQQDTTTFVPPGYNIRVDDAYNMIGERG